MCYSTAAICSANSHNPEIFRQSSSGFWLSQMYYTYKQWENVLKSPAPIWLVRLSGSFDYENTGSLPVSLFQCGIWVGWAPVSHLAGQSWNWKPRPEFGLQSSDLNVRFQPMYLCFYNLHSWCWFLFYILRKTEIWKHTSLDGAV